MQITYIRLKNFKAFQNVEMKDIPSFVVLVGANGTGKSTLFSVFGFLRDAMNSNVTTALAKLGGSRGLSEVKTRNSKGPIEIEIKFQQKPTKPLITYLLHISEKNNRPIVEKEVLKYQPGSLRQPWKFLDFSNGKGTTVTNEPEDVKDEKNLKREQHTLKFPDLLAIKGLAQVEKFPAVVALGNLIEKWYISDFHINKARPEQEAGHAEHLSQSGDNLPLVVAYIYKNHPKVFNTITEKLKKRIPGMNSVEAKQTEEGRILLKFKDDKFKDPFLARHVSDGTIKMLAYLVLLHDPNPHPLLCVGEPENQIYHGLLQELTGDFRLYSHTGGQVFVSTHSPEFLNATELDEVFWFRKKDNHTVIERAKHNKQVKAYMNTGDKMGKLWTQGFFTGVDPQ